jgi:hypothetical protein
MASAMRAVAEENLRSCAVAVELDVGEVDRQTPGGVHGGERGVHVAGHAEVAGVHVQRKRHREIVQRARQRGEDRARRHPVMRVRFIHVELARIELECADAAGIDHLDADALGGVQRPRHVVVDEFLVRARRHQAQQEIIVAEQRITALVHDRRVAHFHVRLARVHRQDRRLETGGVAHLGVAVAGGERRGRGAAAAGTGLRSANALLRWSSGSMARAILTLPPPMWVCVVDCATMTMRLADRFRDRCAFPLPARRRCGRRARTGRALRRQSRWPGRRVFRR